MSEWELITYRAKIGPVAVSKTEISNDPVSLWEVKDKSTQKTQLDVLRDYAADGWELVSVTPIDCQGWTTYLLFTFKR